MALAGNTKELIQKGERASRIRLVFINIVVLILALSINTQSSVHEELDSLMLRGFFKTRSMLGRDVELDPRLFIFNLDDKTTNLIGMPDFGFAGWTYVLETLLERKPKAIVIDKVFSLNLAKANIDKLQTVLRKYDTPVYLGAFFTSTELLEREGWSKSRSAVTNYDQASLARVKKNFAYGPHKDLRDYFRDAGHISLEANARIFPAVPLANGSIIPHLSLLTLPPSAVSREKLEIDGQSVSLDEKGRLQINLLSPAMLRQRAFSLAPVLKDNEQRKELLAPIGPEDVVLILPQMFTGNTDWKDSPRGAMEGGYILASMLNSTLTGQWLSVSNMHWALAFVLILLIGLLPLFIPIALAWMIYVVLTLAAGVVSIVAFSYFNRYLPIGSEWLCFTAVYLPNTFFTARFRESRSQRLIQSLGSSMGPENMRNLSQNPHLVLQKPNQREMSILFLDMVGFSLVSDRTTAQDVFTNLKEIIQSVETIVHGYGGIVDKVLGDGVMCFFGSSIEGTSETGRERHAERAVACAVEIQKLCVRICIENFKAGKLVFPFRVGVNTAQVYFGDIGGDNRIEFTCIGPGVNYAARLEAACEPFKVLIGQDTYSQIDPSPYDIAAKQIQIKHYSEYFNSFEIDPFPKDKSDLQAAIKSYRKFHGIDSREPRNQVLASHRIRVLLGGREARLSDFSRNGWGLEFSVLMSRSSLLDVQIVAVDPRVDLSGIREIFVVEIKQSFRKGQLAHLGVQFKNLDSEQRERLYEFLMGSVESVQEVEGAAT